MNNTGKGFAMPELLAPAGNKERLVTALRFGADAVYLGMKRMSLRNFANNFTLDELHEACSLAHKKSKRLYVTVNAFARNNDIKELPSFLKDISQAGPDALIIADPGVLSVVRETLPEMPVHISTQANTLNAKAALFWHNLGVKRIVVARELSLTEIKEIKSQTPSSLEIEMFIHGAMCVSYSGRCLLSNYMANRDCYKGECAQPCRWQYEFREAGSDEDYYTLEQDNNGTYFINSRDLMLLPYLRDVIDSGVTSLKIEGRMKSVYYVAGVVNAYRMALDALYSKDNDKAKKKLLLKELYKISHRPYTTGFAFSEKDEVKQEYINAGYEQTHVLTAVVLSYDQNKKEAIIEQRNKFALGDELEILSPNDISRKLTISKMETDIGIEVEIAPHPRQKLKIYSDQPLKTGDILRKAIK